MLNSSEEGSCRRLPPRGTEASDKRAEKHADDVKIGRELRESMGAEDDAEDEAKPRRRLRFHKRSKKRT